MSSSVPHYASIMKQFQANMDKLTPLVTIEKTKAHLLLTRAFVQLLEPLGPSHTGIAPSDRLRSFLSRALHRLELYLDHVLSPSRDTQTLQRKDLPPLDVALVLHSYVLSPHRFFEDSLFRFPQLLAVGEFPVTELAELIDPVTFAYKPSPDQCAHWKELTGVTFDPFAFQQENSDVAISCPICASTIRVLWENKGSGFGETDFWATCTNCNINVTHDRLCVTKFFSSLQAVRESDDAFLPGTLINSRGTKALRRPRLVALEIIKIMQDEEGLLRTPRDMNMKDVKAKLYCARDTNLKSDSFEALLRPYTQSTPFSSDIIQTVILQRDFFDKMERHGWTRHEFLSGPCTELEVAYGQYITFLEFMAQRDKGRIIPTEEIDLIWHTHQLATSRYRQDTLTLLNVYLDHVCWEEDVVSYAAAHNASFERWREAFGTEGPSIVVSTYSPTCGSTACGGSMTQDFEFIDDEPDDDAI